MASRRTVPRGIPPFELCLAAALVSLLAAMFLSSRYDGPGEGASRDELVIHTCGIEGLALSPDGRLAASASRDGTVKVWDVSARRECGAGIKNSLGYTCVAFANDGHTLAAGGFDGRVTVWDGDAGTVQETELEAPPESCGALRVLVFSPDGASVVTGGDDRLIRVREVPSGRETRVLAGHTGTVHGLAFAPDGTTLVSVGFDGRVIRWDFGSGTVREQFPSDCGPLWSVTYAPDGRSIAYGGADGITFREVSTGRSRTWRSLQGAVTAVRYLPDGATLASSSLEGAIILWDVARDPAGFRLSLGGQRGRVKALAISPDGLTLVTGSDDAALRFWDLASGRPTAPRSSGSPFERCFKASGS